MFSLFSKKKSRKSQRLSFFKRFKRKKVSNKSSYRTRSRSEKKKRSNILKSFLHLNDTPDLGVLGIVFFFCIGGLIMIFSASAYYAYSDSAIGDSFFYFKRQLIWLILGAILGYVFFLMPLSYLKKITPIIFGVGIILLLYILPEALLGKTLPDGTTSGLQMPLVEALNGAPRWINLQFFYLQPSELVKFGFILYIVSWLCRLDLEKKFKDRDAYFSKVIIPFLLLLGGVSSLILLQRDFDTTVILVLAIMTIYFVSGSSKHHTLGSIWILATSMFVGSIALFMEGYRRARVETFFHVFRYGPNSSAAVTQEAGFQVFNGLVGLASGGFAGNGYGESIIKQGYLQQAAYTDSIFSVIGEEFGFIGTLLVTVGFLYLGSRGLNIARNAKTNFGALTAVGMTSLIVIQGFLNIAAVAVIIPFGGMPLPFFTYGGSSTMITLMAIGVLLNISKKQNQK